MKIPIPFLASGPFLTWTIPIPPNPASATILQTQERHRTLTCDKSDPISGPLRLLFPLFRTLFSQIRSWMHLLRSSEFTSKLAFLKWFWLTSPHLFSCDSVLFSFWVLLILEIRLCISVFPYLFSISFNLNSMFVAPFPIMRILVPNHTNIGIYLFYPAIHTKQLLLTTTILPSTVQVFFALFVLRIYAAKSVKSNFVSIS